uniref:Uncharacterized protein n=1 Tax=Anaerolinea thermolimosa TaxID=229919 RepID=A0A7C4KJB5_9CHLR
MTWYESLLIFMRTLSQILTAGIAITAFSLLLYSLAFNLRDRVVRSFALILVCMVIVFTAEAIGSTASREWEVRFWPRLQWIGIVYLPAIYFHLSDGLLATTGRPSRGRRRWVILFLYGVSTVFFLGLPFNWLTGPVRSSFDPAPHLQPSAFTNVFVAYYLACMTLSWVNFIRAYRRTITTTSRRRMGYLISGAVAPFLGAFPFLPYSQNFAAQHQVIFWTFSVLTNLIIGFLLVVMAYAVAFFGVAWPDRVVKARLFKWLMRGPFTASLTLAVVTILRRGVEALGYNYNATVPIAMVACILICEYFITILAPLGEQVLFYGNDRHELLALRQLENQLVTRQDLSQFVEMVLAAILDRLRAEGAYVISLNGEGSELVASLGKTRFSVTGGDEEIPDEVVLHTLQAGGQNSLFQWGGDLLMPLYNGTEERPELLGLLGIAGLSSGKIAEEELAALDVLSRRAALALRDRLVQQEIFRSLENLSMQMDLLQRLRAAGRFDRQGLLASPEDLPDERDLPNYVKEALSHYWGGPKLTRSPLMRFKIVRDAMEEHAGNQANALRAILRRAIEQVRPEGERRFTPEWILYNILEMKFVEGRKVREIAARLAMSEADLYRKQRIAIDTVAGIIAEMESQARKMDRHQPQ